MNPMHSGNMRPSCADTPTSRVRRTHTRSTSIGKSMLMAKNASKSANALTDTARGDANRACRSVMTAMSDALLVLHFRELGPYRLPIVRIERDARDLAFSCFFNADRIARVWFAAIEPAPPLPDLGIRFHGVTEVAHSLAQLRNGRGTGHREVLVEIHAASLVAFATTIKWQMLRVARATIQI
ncbi:hypothetical protein BCAR13_110093 [Paraburkholderia caribensis]|nr:hypothetical protein BCAR13_110093 [Paraburkholderia caribensis]